MRRTFVSFALILAALWLPGGVQESPDPVPGKDLFFEGPTVPPGELDLAAFESRGFDLLSNWPPAETDPPVDVLHYDLDVAFQLVPKQVSGTVTLTIRWESAPTNVLRLDAVLVNKDHQRGIAVNAVRDGFGVPLLFVQDSSGVDITVVPPPVQGDTITVAVDYASDPGDPDLGFFVGGNASYTFTEPNNSRWWFPCRDVPWDKATLAVHAWAPLGNRVISNGVYESVVADGDGAVHHWREDHPISTYLIACAIANYSEINVASPVTPLTWYVYPAHLSQGQVAFQNVDEMMVFYDALLHPYGFDKYANCEANFGGGMEHQSCTLIGEVLVNGGLTYEWVHAHELAHHWFGDLVTLRDWRDIWLNEGFATFYDAVWHEDFYGPAKFDDRMLTFQNVVFNTEATLVYTIYDPPTTLLFGSLVYYKGAWVLRMLRDLMGKSPYDDAIRDYLAAHAYGNASTADLQAALEARHGESLQWFFDQWIYDGLGHPVLSYTPLFGNFGGQWTVQVAIDQVQAPPRTLYRFPLEIEIATSGGPVLVSGWVEDETTSLLAFEVPNEPLSLTIDPANKILEEHVLNTTTGTEPAPAARPVTSAWPNPFSGRLRVALADGAASVSVFDLQGRAVRLLERPEGGELAWDGTDGSGRRLPPGTYFLRVRETGEAFRVVLLP